MKKIATTVAVAAILVLPTAPAHAAGQITVDREHVCVEGSRDGVLMIRYVLTRFVVNHFDESGELVGESETTAWRRWGRRDYRHKWERLCG